MVNSDKVKVLGGGSHGVRGKKLGYNDNINHVKETSHLSNKNVSIPLAIAK